MEAKQVEALFSRFETKDSGVEIFFYREPVRGFIKLVLLKNS